MGASSWAAALAEAGQYCLHAAACRLVVAALAQILTTNLHKRTFTFQHT